MWWLSLAEVEDWQSSSQGLQGPLVSTGWLGWKKGEVAPPTVGQKFNDHLMGLAVRPKLLTSESTGALGWLLNEVKSCLQAGLCFDFCFSSLSTLPHDTVPCFNKSLLYDISITLISFWLLGFVLLTKPKVFLQKWQQNWQCLYHQHANWLNSEETKFLKIWNYCINYCTALFHRPCWIAVGFHL